MQGGEQSEVGDRGFVEVSAGRGAAGPHGYRPDIRKRGEEKGRGSWLQRRAKCDEEKTKDLKGLLILIGYCSTGAY